MNTTEGNEFASNEDIFFNLHKVLLRSEKWYLINGSFPDFRRHAFDFRSCIFVYK